jgi:hypothetical protein
VRDWTVAYLPWLLSAITIYLNVLAGNKSPNAWLLSVMNQGLWFAWIMLSQSWGFLPMNLALTVVFWRNWVKWRASQPKMEPRMEQTDLSVIKDMATVMQEAADGKIGQEELLYTIDLAAGYLATRQKMKEAA